MQLVMLPECCDYLALSRERTVQMGHDESGAFLTQYKKLTKELSVWLSLGGWHRKVRCERKRFLASSSHSTRATTAAC